VSEFFIVVAPGENFHYQIRCAQIACTLLFGLCYLISALVYWGNLGRFNECVLIDPVGEQPKCFDF
jgi:hypothetical protein